MNITISQEQGQVPVTVLHLHGAVDGSNYKDLIATAKTAFDNGARAFLIDLSEVTFISSSGLVALHFIARMTKGQALPDTEQGWETFRAMGRDRGTGTLTHAKLLNPQPKIVNVLETVGFKPYFEIFSELNEAVASFAG